MKSAPAITFELRPSRLLAAALVVLAALAIAAVWLSGLGQQQPAAAAAVSVICVLLLRHRVQRLFASRWRRVAWDSAGNWLLQDAGSERTAAELLGWQTLGLCLLLRLRSSAGEKLSLVLLPDNLDSDSRRRLRVRLQQTATTAAVPPLN